MKTASAILLPLAAALAACGSKAGVDANGAAADQLPVDLTPDLASVEANKAVNVQQLIEKALPAAIPDAKTAQYRNVRAGGGGAACGEVSGKTTHGFRPFVISPQGVAVVGTSPTIAYEDPSDFLADAWIRWCATPEELQRVATAVQKAKTDPGLANLAIPAPDVPPPVPALPEAKPAKPAPPPPPPQIGSFFNSVARTK